MKKDLLPVTAGDEECCPSRLRRCYSAEKNRMSKGCFKGLVIGALAFLSFFLRQMVRVNTRNDEYIT